KEKAEVRAATRRPGIFCSTVSNSSLMPSEKYSLPLSSLRLANARTATDLALAADLGSADVGAATSTASRRGIRTNLSNTKYPSASTSTAMIMRFIRRPVCGAIDRSSGTSSSRFSPSGVISKIQLKMSAGRNPIASKITMLRGNQSGAPNIGSTVLATCTNSHAPTRYSPAKRMTFRRFSSLKKEDRFIDFQGYDQAPNEWQVLRLRTESRQARRRAVWCLR